jgi:glutamyl-tRNA synthetase
VRPWFEEAGLANHPLVVDPASFARLLALFRPRAKRLSDFVEQARPLLIEPVEYSQEAIEKHLSVPGLEPHVTALVEALAATVPFDEPHVEATVRQTAAQQGIKAGLLIHATRAAVTGRTTSPGLFEVLVLLGRECTLARLRQLTAFLRARTEAQFPQ